MQNYSFKSSHTLEGYVQPCYSYPEHRTVPNIAHQIQANPSKLLIILTQLVDGRRTVKDLFADTSKPQTPNKQSSIENLSTIENQPTPNYTTSISMFSELQSSLQLDKSSYILGSRLSMYSELTEYSTRDFNCARELREEYVVNLFSNGDSKVMLIAVTLLCKYLYFTGQQLTTNNMPALFCTSAVVAFKVSYDQELPGLMKEFSNCLAISIDFLERLESIFLKAIDYDVNIDGKPIKTVMTWFI